MDQPAPLPRARSRTRIPVPAQRRSSTENDSTTATSTILHVAEVHNVKTDSKDGSSGEGEAEDDSSGRTNGNGEKRRKKVKRKGTFLVRHKSPVDSTTDEPNNPTPSDREPKEIPKSRKSSSVLASSKASSIESIKLPIMDTPSSGTPKPSSQILGFESERKIGTNTSSVESIKEAAATFKIPAPPRRGSATETFSESSSDRERNRIKLKPLTHTSRHKKPSGYATETLSEDSSQQNSPSRASSAPLPKPRHKLSAPGTVTVSPEVVTRPVSSRRSTPTEPAKLSPQIPSSPVIPTAQVKSLTGSPAVSIKRTNTPQHSSPNLSRMAQSTMEQHTPEHKSVSPMEISSPGFRATFPESAMPPPDSPSYYTSSSVDYKDVGVIPPPRAKRQKKKRKIKENAGASTENSEKESTCLNEQKEEVDEGTELADKDTVVCITVHRCEPLRMKDLHKRPSVRVHLIDTKTGNYRRSAFGKNAVDVVQTQAFDHIQNRSVVPSWDEDLIFMEPASHVVSADCILIFELLEAETDDVIAWGFLKPLAANGKQNVGTVLRLQLYKPLKSRVPKADDVPIPLAFVWYSKNKLSAYKSTLLVSLHSIDEQLIVRPVSPVAPSAVPSRNQSRRRSSQMSSSPVKNIKLSEAEKELIGVVWSRLPSLSCKLPNKINSSLPAGPDGGMSVSYSRSGLLVACHTSNTISIFTYRGSRYLTLSGHHGLVYDLNWSPDDSFLLSSSADTTACVWNIKLKQTTPVAILSHPSYVYCGTWVGPSLAVTGCYDRALRLWDLAGVPTLLPQNTSISSSSSMAKTATYDPLQCAATHKARINTLAVLSSDEILVSGDSDGVLIFWKLSTTLPRQLELSREAKLRELRGQVINKVSAHPGGKRILVASRDSKLRMVDLQSLSVIQWFHGGVNSKLQSGSCFCGCGSRVLSCSEDGSVSAWDANTGERIALYKGLYLPDSPATLTFHPKDNMFALVSHKVGTFPSLVLSLFTRDASGSDIGIEWLDNISEKLGSSSSVSDLSLRSSRESVAEQPIRKKKKGILRALLQGGTKSKHKKGIYNNAYTDTESGEGTASEANRTERKKRSAYRVLETLDSDGEVNSRLTDIIKRMDNLIMTASPSRPQVY